MTNTSSERRISGAFLSAALRSVATEDAGARKTISAAEVARDIMKPKRDASGHYIDQPSFLLPNFIIEGDLDLLHADVPISVAFSGCTFQGGINLNRAQLRTWAFVGNLTQAEFFSAIGARFEGNLDLRKLEGPKSLKDLPRFDALQARLNEVEEQSGTGVDLPSRCAIRVNLHRVVTQGFLSMDESIVDGELNIGSAEIGGGLYLNAACVALGAVVLLGAHIRGQFSAVNARFISEQAGKDALTLAGARIDGNVFLTTNCTCVGGVDLVGATVSNFYGDGGRFFNANRVALRFDSFSSVGNVFLRDAIVEGRVDFSTAKVAGNLDCRRSRFRKGETELDEPEIVGGRWKSFARRFLRRRGAAPPRALTLAAAEIGGDLRISDIDQLEGVVDLRQAKARILIDDAKWWGKESVRFLLDGFTYDRFGDDPFGGDARAIVSAEARLRWLESQPPREVSGTSFKPQPFSQLAMALTEMGHIAEAKRILFHRDKRIATNQNMRMPSNWYLGIPLVGWLFTIVFNLVIGLTLGFGHLPQRAVITILACLGLGWWVFDAADRAGMVSPNAAALMADEFSPLVFAADVFLPIIDLGEEDAWRVSKPPTLENPAALTSATVEAPPTLNPRPAESYSGAEITFENVKAVKLSLIVFGWFFSTLLAAGVTGLLAKTR